MVRHVLGISGGKDSAALAIYMKDKYPSLSIEYYSCDTGKEMDETYQLISNLESYLGLKINVLKGTDNKEIDPFDHFLKMYGGYLPSSNARWCTKKLKLEPFEKYVGEDSVVSYVGIRGDEDREGYISTKSNIQSIFPFRKNIWSEDVIRKAVSNSNIDFAFACLKDIEVRCSKDKFETLLTTPISPIFSQDIKINALLETDTIAFNQFIFNFLKTTTYPLSKENVFPLISNEDVLVRKDIFKILKEFGVGVPAYYNEIPFEHNNVYSAYARSRSGCYFCFYQQKIEWVWLYEQHPHLYAQAMEYEKDGYTWMQEESLAELIKPERIEKIKEEYIKKTQRKADNIKSKYLLDILDDAEVEGCASCFI